MAVCLSRSALGVRCTLDRNLDKSSEGKVRIRFKEREDKDVGWMPQSKKVEPRDGPGFISLTRSLEMDRLDIDLTEKLVKPKETDTSSENADETTTKWRFAPTRSERKSWAPRKKPAARWSAEVKAVTDPAAQMREYEQLKVKLQLLTVGVGGVGVVASYFMYSPETSLSYGIGLVGSVVYLRMLSKTVEGMGKASLGGAVSNAMGQPRLLVPVVLTMVLNRWNVLLVPKFGLVQLQMIPMLIGFFSYKAATIIQVVQDALPSEREA